MGYPYFWKHPHEDDRLTKAYRAFGLNHSKAAFQDQKAEVSAFVLVVSGVLEEVNKAQFGEKM